LETGIISLYFNGFHEEIWLSIDLDELSITCASA
jgi:hypothetical protein